MLTKKAATQAILRWCRRRKMRLISKPAHVHPCAYVVGYTAPGCLVVAAPWMNAEPQVRDFDRANPLETIHVFDRSLRPGDWCVTAYVSTHGSGQPIAIPAPLKESR